MVQKTASYVEGIACLTSTEGRVCVGLLLIAPVSSLLRSSAAAPGLARAQCEREDRSRSVVASESEGSFLSQLYSTRDHLVSEELGGGGKVWYSRWV